MRTPVGRSDVEAWVQRYRDAWQSNDPEQIGALFIDDARYLTGPFDEPWVGRDVIVREWLARKDEPGSWDFEFGVTAVDGDVAVVMGRTTYHQPSTVYANVWLIRLDGDGRACEFTEWWVESKEAGGE